MSLSVHQDIRLLLFGDNIGNDSFTPDLLIRLELKAFETKKSSFPFYIGIEYSDLNSSTFHRFFIGFGYVTRFPFLKKFNFGAYINHGIILRGKGSFIGINYSIEESSFMGLSMDFETTYPITDKIRLSLLYQAIDRKDLTTRFSTSLNIKRSLFIGVKFAL
ncbi:hypothetical protein KCTC32516_01125 [Polaribacter huanghezhanensis]|uniref:hypothetical protein n=1 Tax=Polaribacter huanghezhanensis TaxID=1354726 RepID=UPI00264966D0|nr:hypothetical protein [Polaribacter huanghezhanensis]WKD85779.1 hypothetical protein KCTC32516_01125 [Polaribacter huanghezhanensis]